MGNLIFIFLFILFVILRAIMAQRGKDGAVQGASKFSRQSAALPADEDDAGVSPAYPPQDFPRAVPSSAFERLLPNADPPKPVAGAAFPQKLDYLPPLKRAVVLAEILGPPKGL
jgi:hypothetical protein